MSNVTDSSAGVVGNYYPLLALPPVVGAGLFVLYISFLLVKRLVDNCRYDVDVAREELLATKLKEILHKMPSLMDADARKSGCFPCLKKRITKAVPTTSPSSTLKDAEEVVRKKLLVSTVVKELQDISRALARLLAARRKVSEWKIPLLRWNGRDYLLSLISPDRSSGSVHLVSVPLSTSAIQKKLRDGRDEEAAEGAQFATAAQLEIAAFEGAQLAIVYKAVQVLQAKIETQWNVSLRILKITAYAFVSLLSFYYVDFIYADNHAVSFLVLYVLADIISNLSTTALVDLAIPRLSAGMDNLVRELELRLKRMALNKGQGVNDWLKTYFDEYNKMQELLRDDYSAYRGESIEDAGYQLVNVVN